MIDFIKEEIASRYQQKREDAKKIVREDLKEPLEWNLKGLGLLKEEEKCK